MNPTRRMLLKSGLLAACAPAGVFSLAATLSGCTPDDGLQAADENGVRLPEGFRSRIVARSGQPPLADKSYRWHAAPDGGACLALDDGGWVYVSNSEMPNGRGGAGALRFNADGELVDAYAILRGSHRNCAGGMTPWGSWLSCEEIETGRVWECDPLGKRAAVARPALGVFNHEAVAVDPVNRQLYLTEDRPDGGLYRFTPDNYPDLTSGQLEVAGLPAQTEAGIRLTWLPVGDPSASRQPTRYQQSAIMPFNGGEGIVYQQGKIWFTTKGDNRIWQYDTAAGLLRKIYSAEDYAKPVLTGVDNITIDRDNNLYVAEDGGDMQVVMVTAQGEIRVIAQIIGHQQSEITGVAFSPDGTRLYFSSQRGETGRSENGVTYEISGAFVAPQGSSITNVK